MAEEGATRIFGRKGNEEKEMGVRREQMARKGRYVPVFCTISL